MAFVDCVMINGIKMSCFHICAHVLKLLEQMLGAYFIKNLMVLVSFYKFHMHDVVLMFYVEHKGVWIYCSLIFDHFLKLLRQWGEFHFYNLGLLIDISSCMLDVNCNEPTLYVGQELINLWWSSPYLCKNDVYLVEENLSLHDLENMNFVIMPILVNFNFAHYEDPFLWMPSLDENAKSFVKMFKNLGIDSVGMIEPNGNKVFGTCVF